MTLPRTAADVLSGHVTLQVESIDRMYLNLYVPQLQRELGVVGFFKGHRGLPFASGAVMAPITDAFVASIHRFADERGLELVAFKPGQRKDDLAQQYLAEFPAQEGIMFIGVAQEKTWVWGTRKRRNPETGATFPWLVREKRVPNQYYFYGVDADFGPFVIKFGSYFPYNGRVIINGHEYAKRQAAKAGVAFEPLDNGFASCVQPKRLQRICDGLTGAKIDRFVRKWLAILPHPFVAADRRAGFRYALSILQAEFSLTQVLDRPVVGRVFFDDVIRHNLDLGRPDRVGLIFDRRVRTRGRRPTPGRFRTRVITDGVTPSLHVDYKHSKIKQYHKLGAALRTETTINDSYDFGIGRGLHNLPALRQVGFAANRRLLDVQRTSHDPFIGAERLAEVSGPVVVDGDRKAPGLRFGDAMVHALLACLLIFRLHTDGFTNADLRTRLADALGLDQINAGRMSYNLRRLRLHGLITRIPGSFRYQLTNTGLQTAIAYTLAHDRVLRTGTAQLCDPTLPSDLRRAYNKLAERSCLVAAPTTNSPNGHASWHNHQPDRPQQTKTRPERQT